MLDDCLPDFKNGIFSTNEEYRKGLISDNGRMTTIKSYENQSTMGLYIRQDWLDQLGLAVPETFGRAARCACGLKNQIPGCNYPMLLTRTGTTPTTALWAALTPPATAPARIFPTL